MKVGSDGRGLTRHPGVNEMTKPRTIVSALLLSLTLAAPAWSATLNTYQVTGPVLEVKPDMVAVQKGKERWEIGRDSSTQVSGDLKVGAKVTIQYRMTAASIEVKPGKGK
jgi:hypothetical protein